MKTVIIGFVLVVSVVSAMYFLTLPKGSPDEPTSTPISSPEESNLMKLNIN